MFDYRQGVFRLATLEEALEHAPNLPEDDDDLLSNREAMLHDPTILPHHYSDAAIDEMFPRAQVVPGDDCVYEDVVVRHDGRFAGWSETSEPHGPGRRTTTTTGDQFDKEWGRDRREPEGRRGRQGGSDS